MVEMFTHVYMLLLIMTGLVAIIHEYPLVVIAFSLEDHVYLG
jgi:hypothetical protein